MWLEGAILGKGGEGVGREIRPGRWRPPRDRGEERIQGRAGAGLEAEGGGEQTGVGSWGLCEEDGVRGTVGCDRMRSPAVVTGVLRTVHG